jgi:hypothetical protein
MQLTTSGCPILIGFIGKGGMYTASSLGFPILNPARID